MGQLANYTIDQVAGALALTLGSVGGLCLILFKSRCETISICWGAWACNRKVAEEDKEEDKKEEEIIPTSIRPLKETDSIGRPIQPEPQPSPQP
tara:strand:- start:480 stop:761 length:282 start_codon:yes stop_codon:yes gene_type:complete